MSRYESYPAYKDSGVEWLGQVPKHWRLIPVCALFKQQKSIGHENEELLSVYRDYGVVPKASRDDNNNKASEDLSTYQLVEPGNLVTNKMKTWQGSIAISNWRGIVSPAYFVFKNLHSETPEYLHHLLRSLPYITGYMSASKGVRVNQWDLDAELFRRFPILLPTQDEQQIIATYLDRETARIDALAAAKNRFIDLLCEKRQALITHAVTKGLDPNVKMKDSGVEWLGQVPEHWKYGRFAYACNLLVDGTHNSPESYPEGDYMYVTAKNIKENGFDLSDITYVSKKDHDQIYPRCPVSKGDVLYIKDGATAGVAMVNNLDQKFSLLSSVALIRPNVDILDSKFVAYQLNSGGLKKHVLSHLVGGAMTRFTLDVISRFTIIRPPLDEQQAIVNYLDRKTIRIDALIAKTERSIELLKERRSALITAAVTGQIDLREATP